MTVLIISYSLVAILKSQFPSEEQTKNQLPSGNLLFFTSSRLIAILKSILVWQIKNKTLVLIRKTKTKHHFSYGRLIFFTDFHLVIYPSNP